MIPPPPIFVGRSFSSNGDVIYNRSYGEIPRVQSPVVWQVAGSQQYARWDEHQQFKIERGKPFGKRVQVPQVRDNGATNGGSHTPDGMRRIRGAHGPINHPQEWNLVRPPAYCALPLPPGFSGNGTCNFLSSRYDSVQSLRLFHILHDCCTRLFNKIALLDYFIGFGQPNNYKRRSPSPMFATQGRDHQWNGHHPMQMRNARTPSPYEGSTMQVANQPANRTSPYQQSEPENEEVEVCGEKKPIFLTRPMTSVVSLRLEFLQSDKQSRCPWEGQRRLFTYRTPGH